MTRGGREKLVCDCRPACFKPNGKDENTSPTNFAVVSTLSEEPAVVGFNCEPWCQQRRCECVLLILRRIP